VNLIFCEISVVKNPIFRKKKNHFFKNKMRFLLGYWNYSGWSHAIRLFLAYVNADYEELRYDVKDPLKWYDGDKKNLGLRFANLPYLISKNDQGEILLKTSESLAILGYLGSLFGFNGSTLEESAEISMIMHGALDLRNEISATFYDKKCMELIPDLILKRAPYFLQEFSKQLNSKDWMVNNRISIADFFVLDILEQLAVIESNILAPYPELQNFVQRFKNLAQMKEYYNSDKYLRLPLYNPEKSYYTAEKI
jgi:glutathione S-transferase